MVFIPYNVPSSKNSKIKTKKGIFHSKTVSKYLRNLGIQSYSSSKKEISLYKTIPLIFPIEELKELFKNETPPFLLGMHFIRDSKRKADFHNLVQLPLDLLTAFNIIDDDNMDCLFPIPLKKENKYYSIDKKNPGLIIEILKHN